MDWLNYHHLRYFWMVAKEGSLARAAAKLHVSQPSISEQVSELENAIGEKLFRREGRKNKLTDVGQLVLGYADQIFSLGQELLTTVKGGDLGKVLRLNVGVVDSLPKLIVHQMLQPVFEMKRPLHIVCREGKIEDLVAQLRAHQVDVVLADEPAGGDSKVRTFTHPLGDSPLAICAAPALAKRLRRGFPGSLNDAPALLPAAHTSLRRSMESWFRKEKITPKVLAEFEDLALMKVLAKDGRGFTGLPTAALKEARDHYGLQPVGNAEGCLERFYAITAERRILHPAVLQISQNVLGSTK